jgi:hypothetical protein
MRLWQSKKSRNIAKLINYLEPNIKAKINNLSDYLNKWKWTTSLTKGMEYNKKRTKRSYYNTQLLNQKGRKISVKKPTTAS